jgi:uncharacterized protein involved in propanediol utilization
VLEEALRELIACKDLKERLEAIEPPKTSTVRNYHAEELREEYERRKEPAWQAARRALASGTPDRIGEAGQSTSAVKVSPR